MATNVHFVYRKDLCFFLGQKTALLEQFLYHTYFNKIFSEEQKISREIYENQNATSYIFEPQNYLVAVLF